LCSYRIKSEIIDVFSFFPLFVQQDVVQAFSNLEVLPGEVAEVLEVGDAVFVPLDGLGGEPGFLDLVGFAAGVEVDALGQEPGLDLLEHADAPVDHRRLRLGLEDLLGAAQQLDQVGAHVICEGLLASVQVEPQKFHEVSVALGQAGPELRDSGV